MAFPEDPLGLRVELLIDGSWTDITADVYTRAPITHQRGIRNEGTSAEPASVPITLNNKSGKYSNRNPMSPYYGLIGRNTRVRLSLPGGTPRMLLPNTGIGSAWTPDTASLDITTSIDVRIEVDIANWVPGTVVELCGKYDLFNAARSWLMLISETGGLTFRRSLDGITIEEFTSWEPIYSSPSGRTALRSTWDGATGVYTHYAAPTIDGPWTRLGPPSTPGATGSLYQSSAPIEVGDVATLGYASPEGSVYAFQLRNGINGTIVADVDFTALSPGTTAFTDAAGLPWRLSGTAEISDRATRFIGEISEWPQKWVPSEADAWVPVQAAGILRRLGRGTKALDSSLRRRIPSFEPMAYWPMEEGESATKAASPLPGASSLSFTNVQWASDDSLPSSGALPTIQAREGANAFMFGLVRNTSWASLPAWSVIWMYRMPQVPPNRRTYMMIYTTGTVRQWFIQMGPDNSRLLGLGYEGETLVDKVIATSKDIFGVWVKCRFAVEQQGNSIRYALVWTDVGGDAGFYQNTVTGTTGRPTGVASPTGGFHPDVNGMAIGHISVWDSFDTNAYDNAIMAWSGETAGARMLRLSEEEGIPVSLTGPPASTEPVGNQEMAPVLGLVRTAADADGGMLTEDQTALRLLYRPRSTLYSQEPALVLDYAQGQIAGPLEPVDDDTAIRNDVTVKREDGSSTRVVLGDGPLSVLDPPDGVGVYDTSITLSLATDAQTEPKAFWELHLGTWDEPRYPAVTVNLHRHPELIPAVLAMREGDVIRLTRMPHWVAPDDVDLMVMGLKEQLLPRTWTVTFDCVPAGPWRVGVVGDEQLGIVDTDGSELDAAAGASDTTLTVKTTSGPQWRWETAFDVRVGGEVVTVNAITPFAQDTFTRSVTGGWGTANSGLPWTAQGGTLATDYDVNGTTGRHVHTSRGAYRITTLPAPAVDVDLTVTVTVPVLPAGDGIYLYVLARSDAAVANFYFARLYISTTGTAELSLRKRAPAEAVLATAAATLPHVAGASYRVRLRAEGSTLRAKAWRTTTAEPAAWQVTATDTDLPGPGVVGLRSYIGPASTNTLPVAIAWDDLSASPQLMHVTRSTNGIVKPHARGSDVRLANPMRLAL
ncbi:hypothetical protein ACFVOO_16305 [Streptomyces rochei]|uniref:hypothetical protein n=1 Tax=Streptomyces rochei TaxID=1928 RepID=UPI0036AD85BE